MKKILLNIVSCWGILVIFSIRTTAAFENSPLVSDASTGENLLQPISKTGSGMPGWPVPAQPIPHHEPGQPFRGGDVVTQVTQLNTLGVEETVELRGIDAMLANGTMTDPFQGNYRLVGLDKVMFGSYDYGGSNNFSVRTFEFVTPTLVLTNTVSYGNYRFNAIAAGDLNGDLVDEQITAWVTPGVTPTISMNIDKMPGSFGRATSAPAAIAHANGDLDVLVRGYDHGLWDNRYDGSWGSWSKDGGGVLLSGPSIASRVDEELDAFAVGMDNQVYHNHGLHSPDQVAWSGWVKVECGEGFDEIENPIFLPEIPAPAVAARSGNQLDLFRRGPDNTLRWCHSSDGVNWGSWETLHGMLASGPGAVSLGDGRMQVYALGMDGALWYRTHSGGWGAWQRLETPEGVAGNAFPVLTSPAEGQVTVYLAGAENRIWSIHHNGSSWGSWSSIDVTGGDLSKGIGAAYSPSGTYLFAHMADGSLLYSLNASGWTTLEGLESPSYQFSTGVETKTLPDDSAIENSIFDIATGYFSGDGRQQVVLAYEGITDSIRLEIFDVYSGFVLTKTAELSSIISGAGWPRVAAGDVDGDGLDEIGLVYVPDSPPSYQGVVLEIYQIDKDSNGQWTGDLNLLSSKEIIVDSDGGDIWSGSPFGGTLCIEAGDIQPDTGSSNDEFAIVSDWRHDSSGNWRQIRVFLHIYDYQTDSFITDMEFHKEAADESFWNELFATGVGLAVGDVDGVADAQNRVYDEVIITRPRGWDGNDYPDLERDLVVYGWQDSDLIEKAAYEIPWYSRYSYLDTLAVGDLDMDLKSEIVIAAHTQGHYADTGYVVGVYEFESLSSGPLYYYYGLAFGTPPRAFNLALGDFTGDSIRVGPPSYRRQHDVGQVTAVVNAPPKHEDVIGGTAYNLNADDADTYSQYEQVVGNSTEVSVTTHKDWGVDSEFKSTVGNPEGTHVTTSLENSYGENFSNTGGATQTLTYQQTVGAVTHDAVFYTRLDYDVWEYPVYDSHSLAPQGYMSVVWPVGGMQSAVESTHGCDGWYWPNHELMNVWSYPKGSAQLLDRAGDGSRDLLDSVTNYEIGVNNVDFSVEFSTIEEMLRSHDYHVGFAAGLETQIGGDEVGVNLGVVSFSTRLPSLFFSSRGHYDYSELSEWRTETTESTTLSGFFEPFALVNPENYKYWVTPYLYWSENDYLVIDYVTDPSNQAFWSSSGANYNKPDPAFLLPWREGQCDHLWIDAAYFSSDISVDPPIASVGEVITITATIRNFSKVGNNLPFNQSFNVVFYQGDPDSGGSYIGQQTVAVGELSSRAVIQKSIQWVAEGSGEQHIYAVIDSDNSLSEVHDENDPYINNNKGYGVLTMNTIEFVDVGQAIDKAYQDIAFQMGDPAPTSTLYIPLETWTENLRVDLQTTDLFGGLSSLGTPFEVVVYQEDWETPEENFSFAPIAGDPPAVVLIDYAGADLTGFDENLLTLFYFNGIDWEPANLSCGLDGSTPLYPILRLPQDELLFVSVCKTGFYMLSDDESLLREIYLPLILR